MEIEKRNSIIAKMIEDVSTELGVDIKSNSRKAEIVLPRQVMMYTLKEMIPSLKLAEIGAFFNKDHSTVIHSINCFDSAKHLSDPTSQKMRDYHSLMLDFVQLALSEMRGNKLDKKAILDRVDFLTLENSKLRSRIYDLNNLLASCERRYNSARQLSEEYKAKYLNISKSFTKEELNEINRMNAVNEKYITV